MKEFLRKVVVTGGAGFIGSFLCDGLAKEGFAVHSIDVRPRTFKNKNIQHHVADVSDAQTLLAICKEAEFIFHLAAIPSVQYSIEEPVQSASVNLLGTIRMLEYAHKVQVKRFINTSSSAVYGDQARMPIAEDAQPRPKSPYGLQKLQGEEYCRLFSELYGLETVSLRYFNVYGPGQSAEGPYASVIAKFLQQRKAAVPLTIVGDGSQTRDFVHVQDVVRANIAAATSRKVGKGEALNIGGGKEYSVNEIADLFAWKKMFVPAREEIRRSAANIRKARELLGWTPAISLERGLPALLQNA